MQKKLQEKRTSLEDEKDELVAKLFRMFEEKKSPCDAVIEHQIRPEVAQNYYRKWRELKAHSPLNEKVRLLWFIFNLNLGLCKLFDQMFEKMEESPSFERVMPDSKFNWFFRGSLAETIVHTSVLQWTMHVRCLI